MGGKWKIPIILSIYTGNKRFNDILNSIPKITNRVLSKELKHLEEFFLITTGIISDYPVRIEYAVTLSSIFLNHFHHMVYIKWFFNIIISFTCFGLFR
ncbi:helix-turn-helix domain-containing protein [Pedobacter sp.]|uniref:winged helix-turn-helix transcriptional regulator n=1 Tax=Pedobacter sp. TaxID=1411316 RepID=UPI002D807A93|nr:helix-turn-helix domain-containing protein [Pedobacter sp.]